MIHLRGTKTDASNRVVPLHPELAEILWAERRPVGAIVGARATVGSTRRAEQQAMGEAEVTRPSEPRQIL
jgi:integrase